MNYKTDIYSVTSRINREGRINHQYNGRQKDANGDFHSLSGIETGDMSKPYEVTLIESEHRRILGATTTHKIKSLTTKIILGK